MSHYSDNTNYTLSKGQGWEARRISCNVVELLRTVQDLMYNHNNIHETIELVESDMELYIEFQEKEETCVEYLRVFTF